MGSVYRRKIIPVCVFLLFGVVSQLLSNCCLRCLKPPIPNGSRAYIKARAFRAPIWGARSRALCAPILGARSLRAWGARSLRAWGARFLRAWGGRFLRAWCGECFFQARPSRWVFLLCFALPCSRLVHGQNRSALQYRCPRQCPRVCFIPAP